MITTFTGPMHSGKSETMIRYYNKIYNKDSILVFKPKVDTRDDKIYNKGSILVFKPKVDTRDEGIIRSKGSSKYIDAICIRDLSEIADYVTEDITNIFIDEIQFMKGSVKTLLKLSIMDDIDIYCAGLNMTSEQEPFGIMPQVLAVSDKIVNTYSSCNVCGRKAIYTYYDGNKESDVLVGDDGYKSLCRRCLRRILVKNNDNRLTKQ